MAAASREESKAAHPSNVRAFELLRSWRAGDRRAGEDLVREYQPKLAQYLYAKIGAESGKEVVQETFLALCEQLERYRGEGSFEAFLFGVARYKVLEHKRRLTMRLSRQAQLSQEAWDAAPSTEDWVQAKFASNVIVQALRRLPPAEQILLELHDHANFSRGELAELYEVPPGTVASRLDRARKRLHAIAQSLEATPEELETTQTSLATYWAHVHARWLASARSA